jgi:hypothetical protein
MPAEFFIVLRLVLCTQPRSNRVVLEGSVKRVTGGPPSLGFRLCFTSARQASATVFAFAVLQAKTGLRTHLHPEHMGIAIEVEVGCSIGHRTA